MTREGWLRTLGISILALVAGYHVVNLARSDNDAFVAEAGAAVIEGGTVTGVVRFPDEYPERQKITITKDQAVCGAFQYSELFVVSEETKGLKNVVVTIRDVEGKVKPSEAAITIDQTKCQYVPHVQAVPVGSKLQILNSDGVLHNVHAYFDGLDPQNTVFNKAQPKFLKKISQDLDKAGMYYYKCDVHDHMNAFIAVMDHPYYAVTADDGSFSIAGVPAGTYSVGAWHEALGSLKKEVTVKAGQKSEVVFDILPNE